MLPKRFENAALYLLALLALAMCTWALVVRARPSRSGFPSPSRVSHWSEISRLVASSGARAPIVIVEFVDFECPYCRDLSKSLRQLEERFPGQIAIVIRHFPLTEIHGSAVGAALAWECAGAQGRATQAEQDLFANQDSIGIWTFARFASHSGVPDTAEFSRCMSGTVGAARVREDTILGKRIGVTATPTVIVNGWLVHAPPTLERLDSLVKALLPPN
jgi:protein-disulfide isomerase